MTLAVVQIAAIKALVDTLADLDMSPLHLHIDTKHQVDPAKSDTRPDISMWAQTRTDFERLCAHLGIKPTEARLTPLGQRLWHAIHDTPDRRVLIQCCSLEHHHDWQPKPATA